MSDSNVIFNNNPEYENWTVDVSWVYDDDWTIHKPYIWDVKVAESFTTSELFYRDREVVYLEQFGIADRQPVFETVKSLLEALSVVDLNEFSLTFLRRFDETVKIVSQNGNSIVLPFSEALKVYDALKRTGRGVFSDVIFKEGEWSIETIKEVIEKGGPAGYTEFKPFIYGDYNYKDAMFRTVLNSDGFSIGVIEQFKITVDVPDVNDRGSDEVVDKNYDLRVYFNKKFLIAPEVGVTIRSGTTAEPLTPNITNITEEYFDVYLLNVVTGQRATGKFIWTAVGY